MRVACVRVCCVAALALAAGCAGLRLFDNSAAMRDDVIDWAGARWIGDGKPQPTNDAAFYEDDPAPLFRKTFTVKKLVKLARLHIAGLGLYSARVNGETLNWAPAPLWTPYGKRVLVDTYDVAPTLRNGENVLAVELGNGWYNPLPLRMWGRFNLREALAVGRPCFIAELDIEYADGSRELVVTDAAWKAAEGPRLRNSLYLGEVYDARKEIEGWSEVGFDDAAWRPAVPAEGPSGRLVPRRAPPVEVRNSWSAAKVTEPKPGVYVADMGGNFAGQACFQLGEGSAGERVTFRYGELLNQDGTVNRLTGVCGQIKRAGMGGPGAPDVAEQCDVYFRRGGGHEVFRPLFTWHGFRYVQIEGLARAPARQDIVALPMASSLEDASVFECSSPLLNDLHMFCRNTFLSNLMGVQSDCPARERFGYGADIAVTTEALIFNFDMRAFYAKTVQDFADEAADDGWFTETAPFVGIAASGFGGRAGPIGWTVVVPILMRDLYRYYGDRDVIARHYAACARYVDLVRAKCPDLIVPRCIGDHEALEKAPEALTATAHFYQWASLVSQFASILGKKDDAKKYGAMAEEIQAAFRKKFVVSGKVGGGRQGEQVFGLYHRLVAESDRAAALGILRRDIEAHGGALTTGIFGTKYLLEVLSFEEGFEELAGKLAARREFPSWGYMLDNGATTLWETWKASDNTYSQNHPMFGSIDEWLMKHALGISVPEDAVGCDRVAIRPKPVAGLTWARGEYRSVRGPIKVDWKLADGKMRLAVELPKGVTAKVWLADKKRWVRAGAGRHEW